MPLVYGQAISYSPLLYRARASWRNVRDAQVGAVVQPQTAHAESPSVLDAYALRIDHAFARAAERLAAAHLDALVVLIADRGRAFDATNTPQLHILLSDEVWGDSALKELGEPPERSTFRCDPVLGALLAEELAYRQFDISESRETFRPVGDPLRGVSPALVEPLRRLGVQGVIPIVPIHINCHVAPVISAHRMLPFGATLASALDLVPERVGILASGGMSGDPGGMMAGWIDDVLDGWVLDRLQTGRSHDLGRIFDVESQTLLGTTREIRLWIAAAAAMENLGARGVLGEYMPLHHAGVGTAFMHWEG